MRKNYLKVFNLVTVFAIILTFVSTNFTFAASMPEVKVTVSKTDVQRGEEFTAVVSLNTNSVPDITGLQFKLKYDPSILEVVGTPKVNFPIVNDTENGIFEMGIANNNVSDSASEFAWTTDQDVGKTYNGNVYTTTFKVKDDAALGNSALTIDASDEFYPVQNSISNEKIESTINNTSVNVVLPLKSISFGKTTETLNVDDNDTLTVVYDPEDTTDSKVITWTTSNKNVVTVQNGKVTAVGKGTATITATVGSKTAKCTYTVYAPLKSISLEDDVEMLKGQTKKMTISYDPIDTTDDKTVAWSSDNTEVVTIDENGQMKALKAGTATIKAIVGDKEASTQVTVTEIPLNTIAITELDDTLLKGYKTKFTITYNPEDTTDDKTVTWESSDPTIATVDQDGVVEALKEGEVTITAKVGEKTATRDLTIKEFHLESATIFKDEADILAVGTEIPLWIKLNPEDCTDTLTYEFISSDESVATIDEYGYIKGIKEGSVTITAKITTEYGKEVVSTVDLTVESAEAAAVETEVNTSSPQTGDLPILTIVLVAALALTGSIVIAKKKLIKQK